MVVRLKDVVIHITYFDPFAGFHMTIREVMSQFTPYVILLYCFGVCVLKVMLFKCVLAIILPQ